METSILKTVKTSLGINVDDTTFDAEVILFTNSALATLNQIGVGPEVGFQIVDASATWDNLLGSDMRLNSVQQYIYTKVRLAFDPPQSSFGVDALQQMAKEYETRIYLKQESEAWAADHPLSELEEDDDLLDGGTP